MKRTAVLILAGLIFLNGCTMAPKYKRPVAPVPAEWPVGAAYPAPEAAGSVSNVMRLK